MFSWIKRLRAGQDSGPALVHKSGAGPTQADVGAAIAAAREARLAGRAAEARGHVDRALQQVPEHPDALVESALQHRAAGDPATALAQLDAALDHAAEPALVHLQIARTHVARSDLTAAVDALTQATALDADCAAAWILLGRTLGRLDQDRAATEAFEQAASRAPEELSASDWFTYGQCLHVSRRIDDAIEAYRKSLALEPKDARVLTALGNTYALIERDAEALAFFEQALAAGPPEPPGLRSQLGAAYQFMGRWHDAQRIFESLVARNPSDIKTRWLLSQCDLTLCNWARGWSSFNTRFAAGASPYRALPFKTWRGEPAPQDTLLIVADQGIGDEIMFAWCVPDAVARVGHCILECEPRLAKLFQRSFPGVTVVPSERFVDGRWLKGLPEPQWQIFGGDLPALFRASEESFVPHTGYLKADPERVRFWKQRLNAELGPGLKVGISWRGGTDRTRSRSRSMDAADWAEILAVPGCRFVNLQYGDYSAELDRLRAAHNAQITDYPEAIADYDETAALVAALDLVVTVCTAVVHLGGALGKPVWVLVPFSPAWRYTVNRDRMPWYPSTRLYRQVEPNDWRTPTSALALALSDLTSSVAPGRSAPGISTPANVI